jgi:hypothetical protein
MKICQPFLWQLSSLNLGPHRAAKQCFHIQFLSWGLKLQTDHIQFTASLSTGHRLC